MGQKGGGSQTVVQAPQLTQEQKDLLRAQTDLFTKTLGPTYERTVEGAKDIYQGLAPGFAEQAQLGQAAAGRVGDIYEAAGTGALGLGLSGLSSVFGPEYQQQQLEAALQPGQEQYARDISGLQTRFGGAGGLGSARSALAGANLASLQSQRQGTVAAQTLGNIENLRAGAAGQLAAAGAQGLGAAINARSAAQQFAGSPLDLYNKYAGVVFGVPGASVNPNFAGTQGSVESQRSRSWSKGI